MSIFILKKPVKMNININTTNISINQSKESGFAILFIHGNTLSSKYFESQLNSDILSDFRLISFDLPGHGNSEKAYNSENLYCFDGLVDIIKQQVDKLELKDFILVGHSLGGHIAIQALNNIPNVKGIMVCGTPPLAIPPRFDLAFLPEPKAEAFFKPAITEKEALGIVDLLNTKHEFKEKLVADILSSDPLFRQFLFGSIAQGRFKDEIQTLNNFNGPVCISFGENENIVNKDYINSIQIDNIWKGKVQEIENSGHLSQLDNPIAFNYLLFDFVSNIIS